MKASFFKAAVLLGAFLLAGFPVATPAAATPTPLPSPTPTWTPLVFPQAAGRPFSATEHQRNRIVQYTTAYRVEMALEELGRYQESYPDDPWGYLQRGQCRLMLEDYAEAEADTRRAIERGADPVESALQLAEVYTRWGKVESARGQYEKALEIAPQKSEVHWAAGSFFTETKTYEEAVFQFRLALRLDPDNPQYLFSFGQALEASGDVRSALGAYTRQIEIQYATPEQYLRLGDLYLDRQRYNEAAGYYEEFAGAMPRNLDAYMLLGKAYSGAGQYRKSLQAFLRAHQLKPRNPQPLLAMGQISRRMKENDRALQVYAKVLVYNPKNPQAHFGRAEIFAEQGKLAHARDEARRASEVLANNGTIRALRAAIHRALGEDTEAEKQLELARAYAEDGQALYEAFLEKIPRASSEGSNAESPPQQKDQNSEQSSEIGLQ